MKRITKIIFLFFILFLNFQKTAFAGDVGGPYVIWVNLSNNKTIDELIARRIDEHDDCIPPDAKFLLNDRPDDITDELLHKAVIKNDKASIKLLEKIMRRPFGLLKNGFDGIITYDEEKTPRFSSVVTGWHAVAREKIPKPTDADKKSVWDTFCIVIPPITRNSK
ncbi:MAG TPA: hypothetical protein VIF82_04895 [Burkholderiaceae bacterium]|jgi:hypothetical protein